MKDFTERKDPMGRPKTGKTFNYKDWYEENKKKISERRKAKYQSDPQYKAKIIARNKNYRRRKAGEDVFSKLLAEYNEVTQIEIKDVA